MIFDPLSSQQVVIMAPVLGHVASSQQFWDERGQNCISFNRGQNRNILKLRRRIMQFSLKYTLPSSSYSKILENFSLPSTKRSLNFIPLPSYSNNLAKN